MKYVRNQCFDPKHNQTTVFGQLLAGYPYDEELAGPLGAHFHVWVPEGTSEEELTRVYDEACEIGDLVSFSYDWLPAEGIWPKHGLSPVIDSLRYIVRNRTQGVIRWSKRSWIGCDVQTANAVVQAYDRVRADLRPKIDKLLLEGGPNGLVKIAQAAWGG